MIGILDAYHFDTTAGNYQETYMPMMLDYLKLVIPNQEYKHYKVAQNQFPRDLSECSGYVITGSPASCYENEPWIHKLMEVIKELDKKRIKTLGICFGHQIIAHALGGEVVNSDKGWGIGVRSFDIVGSVDWMNPPLQSAALLFSHQDQVTKLPPGSKKLAGDDFCEFQIYSKGDHIFSIQGHPEFTVDYSKARYSTRVDRIGKEVYEQGMASLKNPTDHIVVGKWIKNFFEKDS